MPTHFTEAQLNEPVANYVRKDFTILHPEWTVGEALDHMRQFPPPGRIIYFYVVDDEGRLQGVVPTRRLVLSPLEGPVTAIMVRPVITLRLVDRTRPTYVDSVWAEVQPRTF